jgi:hypothetical protein
LQNGPFPPELLLLEFPAVFIQVRYIIHKLKSYIPLIKVDGGQRAVIFDRISGIKQSVIGEGMHFIIPWLQRAIIFDVKTRPRTISTTTGSKGIACNSLSFYNT